MEGEPVNVAQSIAAAHAARPRAVMARRLDESWPGAGRIYLGMRPGERRPLTQRVYVTCDDDENGPRATLVREPLTARERSVFARESTLSGR